MFLSATLLLYDSPESAQRLSGAHGSEGADLGYFVYILCNKPRGTLYVGASNDLARRVWEHRNKIVPGFTAKYGVDRLVWFEPYDWIDEALLRENRIKHWRRDWKIRLIEASNPDWYDLYPGLSAP
jgi:putative endonuclease